VDLGGGLSGFQFTVAKGGSMVTNVDPFSDYGSMIGYDALDPEQAIARLNRIFRTSVRLERRDLVAAALPAHSVDVVYCISTLEHLDAEARAATLREVARVLGPGGRLVLTVDLFLDLAPFTTRASNRYGTNVDLAEVVEQSGLTLEAGRPSELFGFPDFDADRVQANLSEYLIGGYPAMAQCLILRQP
jgi:SAM-dependent methyltransferase